MSRFLSLKTLAVFGVATALANVAIASKARDLSLGAVNGGSLPSVIGTGTIGVVALGVVSMPEDEQAIFTNPAKVYAFGDLAVINFGTSGNAEAGIFRSSGTSKLGLYFNHRSELMNAVRGMSNGGPAEQNPFEIVYGMNPGALKWAASLWYADTKPTTTSRSNSVGLRFGVVADVWEAYAGLGLIGKIDTNDTTSARSTTALRLGGQYSLENVILYGDLQSNTGENSVPTKMSEMAITLGIEDKLKGDTTHFVYGARLINFTQKLGDQGSATATKLPLYLGIETEAATWLLLRATFSQSVLINTEKITSQAGAETLNGSNRADSTVAFGAGVKFGKLLIDGSLASDGTFGFANLMGNLGLSYMF